MGAGYECRGPGAGEPKHSFKKPVKDKTKTATELTCSVCGGCGGCVHVFCGKGNEDEEGFGQTVSCFDGIRIFLIRIFYYKVFRSEIDLFHFLLSAYVCVEVEMGSIFL